MSGVLFAIMITFETIINALDFSNKPLANKCSDVMKNEKIIFSPGFTQTFFQLYDVYKMRYETAVELKRLSYSPEEMEGWAKSLNNLKNSKLDMLSLSVVQDESFVYLLYISKPDKQ